jgi:hypothetical protein
MLYCMFDRYIGLAIEEMKLLKMVKCNGDVAMDWRPKKG